MGEKKKRKKKKKKKKKSAFVGFKELLVRDICLRNLYEKCQF